ncbi:GntR family transcriptional regulator [Methylobacterium planeticum]|uniref:GntR family transcriptional regulator n=1 Tax=Methylobacterium planeticum TaxID=2615211 RepID=A0A6N6MQC7_9HYPH|nr:GntR family transcriptional regulator [Methylobacterium planeticum]KAB1072317.1 GntR family transcriptional regulator [Methylobacterium planeticum]
MAETRYAQVARDLTEGIASGRFPVGSTLPTELDLCAHYGASRHTVRVAIRELQDLGLVTRNKKAGTRVETSVPVVGYRQALTSVEDLIQFGAAHVREVRDIAEVEIAPALAAHLGCPVGSRWLRISSFRRDGKPGAAPVGCTDVYVDPAYAEIGEIVRASPDVLISTLIEQRYDCRIAEIRQDVQAVRLSPEKAALLQAETDAPALRILRRYLDSTGRAVEISDTLHPADRFTVTQRLRRE